MLNIRKWFNNRMSCVTCWISFHFFVVEAWFCRRAKNCWNSFTAIFVQIFNQNCFHNCTHLLQKTNFLLASVWISSPIVPNSLVSREQACQESIHGLGTWLEPLNVSFSLWSGPISFSLNNKHHRNRQTCVSSQLLPDRPFHNFKASKLEDWLILWSRETSRDGFYWNSKSAEKSVG